MPSDAGRRLPPATQALVERANLSLHAAHLLRDRAAGVAERVGRKGRPRERFLAEQRARLAAWSLPTLATIAVLSGALAAITLVSDDPQGAREAAIVEALVAMIAGASAIVVPLVRRRNDALVAIVVAGCVLSILGWALAARLTGGATSPYLLVVPLCQVIVACIVPLPYKLARWIAGVGYVGLLLAAPRAPLMAHFLVLSLAIGGAWVARGRHRMILRAFMRVERANGALKRLRRMQDQLVVVEKLEALRVLVGGMAHELNNALAISQASNQQAQKKLADDPTAAQAAIRRSDGGLARIKATVDRLRRFAMAADGVLEPADVGAMLDFALESAIGRARSGVVIERDYDPRIGTIRCHVSALAEALFQVARNAVEAMPGGGTIRASVRSEGDGVVLSLADQGRGIPAEQLKHVFDPYWQAAGKANKSGMGLSAVYGLVSALGGSVKLASEEGKGTTVSIVMPSHRDS
jgi:signal transduction histidine kinase